MVRKMRKINHPLKGQKVICVLATNGLLDKLENILGTKPISLYAGIFIDKSCCMEIQSKGIPKRQKG